MNKFNWVAQDRSGSVYLYKTKPEVTSKYWWTLGQSNLQIIWHALSEVPNWKDSLIDLSKNDYIIKDGILMATRKHAALIHAWADGAIIQYQNSDGKWADVVRNDPSWRDDETYRIKPKTNTVKFRNYINLDDGRIGVSDGLLPPNVKWLDDWQTVEVEIEL